jgi:AraC-like DNA-binding protein
MLLEKRLHDALQLMSSRNKTVSEAAFESGFENPSRFSLAFKLRFGKGPTAMKRKSQVEVFKLRPSP